MATADDATILNQVDDYWGVVKKTFRDVLKQGQSDSVDAVRHAIDRRPAEEQLHAYHREPLYTAADIAGLPVDDQMVADYLKIADQLGWKSHP